MRVVGLTGGIGSGKSTVSQLFAELGVPISDADLAARAVVEPGQPALKAIAEHFGAQFIRADGSLNRPHMRQAVFSDTEKKAWLEALLHPLIMETLKRELSKARGHYAILSSPLLFETKQNILTQRNVVVDTTQEQQIARSTMRDNNDAEQIRAIIRTQLSRDKRLALADDILDNTGDLEETKRQVLELHRKYLQL